MPFPGEHPAIAHVSGPDLRRAMHVVAPTVPEIAPYLTDEPDIVRNALLRALDIAPAEMQGQASPSLDKTERYTLFYPTIAEQRNLLTGGSGTEAHFRHEVPPQAQATPTEFKRGLRRLFRDSYEALLAETDWVEPALDRSATLSMVHSERSMLSTPVVRCPKQ